MGGREGEGVLGGGARGREGEREGEREGGRGRGGERVGGREGEGERVRGGGVKYGVYGMRKSLHISYSTSMSTIG